MEPSRSFAALLGRSPDAALRALNAFHREIGRSLISDGVRVPTRAEVKRRFEICAKIFTVLVGDMQWGVDRALGHIGVYLRMELDGLAWEPSRRAVWMPNE